MREIHVAEKLIRRKRRQYEIQNRQFSDMKPDTQLAEYLDRVTFINKDGDVCEFTALQKHDLNLVLQKRYALLGSRDRARQRRSITVPNTCSNSARYGTSSYWLPPSPPT